MVAVSNLINNGLLLAGQLIFGDLATPEQAATEQYNIVKFLGGSAPYVQNAGFGLSLDIPPQCELQQVQLMTRHGERYPTTGTGASFEAIMDKVKAYNETFQGVLSFFNDYTYFVPDSDLYEKETTPSNSQGPYAGTVNAMKHGMLFRSKYDSLFLANETLNVFTSNSVRVHLTSEYFARGFMGEAYDDLTVNYYIIAEEASQGANSLTPRVGCLNYDEDASADAYSLYNTSYLDTARARILEDNPLFNLTKLDVSKLFQWCAYEINVRGASPVCDLFTNEEYVRYSYSLDLSDYYSNSFGNNLTAVASAPLLNATTKFLAEEDPAFKVVLMFTHDTDIEFYNSALGLYQPDEDLPADRVPFPSPYNHVSLTPQGARLITEKYKCGETSYVRFVLNDAVFPLKHCQNGPGFSCEISEFQEYIAERIQGKDYWSQCGAQEGAPTDTTFLWDYATSNYTAADFNG